MLKGKRGVILGVANRRSIAWAVAQSCHAAGAELAFSVIGDRLEKKVRPLVEGLADLGDRRPPPVLHCNVDDDASLDSFFAQLSEHFDGKLDFVVHAIAFAQREDLEGTFLATGRGGFHTALGVSAYSLTAVAQRAAPLMTEGGSIITLTYLGADRVLPGYNVMGVAKAALEASVRYLAADLGPQGVRVNAISAGPISTLSARGIKGFTKILDHVRERAPLKRNTEAAEVGDTALFLASHLSRGITGEVIFCDCGYNTVGM